MKNKFDDTFLARWLVGNLSDKELDEFKNSQDFALYEKIASSSTKFKEPDFDAELLYNKIAQRKTKQETKVKRLVPNWVYLAAASVVLLIGVTYFFNSPATVYTTKIAEVSTINLPDGSIVELNAGSELSFKEKDWENGKRLLKLKGQGYFKVQKGSKFTVDTKYGDVTVLGTQFDVTAYKKYIDVKCYEGKVGVKTNSGDFVLTQGNQVTVSKGSVVKQVFEETNPLWKQGLYKFNAVPLEVVLIALKNQYDIHLKLSDVDTSIVYSGVFINENLETALKSICLPLDIDYEIEGKQVTLSK